MKSQPHKPASVAQSDARPDDNHEVMGSIPAGSGNIVSWILIMKYSLPSDDTRKRLSVSVERLCKCTG